MGKTASPLIQIIWMWAYRFHEQLHKVVFNAGTNSIIRPTNTFVKFFRTLNLNAGNDRSEFLHSTMYSGMYGPLEMLGTSRPQLMCLPLIVALGSAARRASHNVGEVVVEGVACQAAWQPGLVLCVLCVALRTTYTARCVVRLTVKCDDRVAVLVQALTC